MTKRRGHGEGSIYQRESDGLWVAAINVGWVWNAKLKKNTRRRKYFYGPTFEDVREQLASATADRDRGITVSTDRQTVAEFFHRWIAEVVEGRVTAATAEQYRVHVDNHIVPVIGRLQLAKVTAQDVNAVMRARERHGAAPRSVRLTLAVLRMGFKQALLWDLVPRNVAELAQSPKVKPFESIALNSDQISQFLGAAETDRLGTLFMLAVMLGPRHGELLGLRWSDVDLDKREFHIRQAKKRTPTGTQFGDPKTSGSKRTVSLPAMCVDALRAHRKAQLEEHMKAGPRWQQTDLVFTSTIGTPVDDRLLRREFRDILAAAELPVIRFHDLRHTAITTMLQQGIQPHVVAKIVGHTTLTTTLAVYAKVVGSTMSDAAATLNTAFATPKSTNKVSS